MLFVRMDPHLQQAIVPLQLAQLLKSYLTTLVENGVVLNAPLLLGPR
jgi:hypothetical protein